MAIEVTTDLNLVDTSQLVDGSVTSAKIGTGAVGSAALASGAVVAASIAAGAVGSATLADNAVVAAKISAGSVGTVAISSGSATSGQILQANGSGAASFETLTSGGMTLIATSTVSAATSVSFSGIPSTYEHLIVQWKNVSMDSTSGYWNVRINSDTTSSYSWVSLSSNGPANASRSVAGSVGKVVRFGGTNDYTAVIGSTASATTDFSLKAYGRLTINDYSSGSTSKGIESLSFSANGAAIYVNFLGGMYDKTDVVTSVNFVRSATETITGTFYLYGVS